MKHNYILIKGMEMPTRCPCELLGIGYDLYCSFAAGIPARVKEYYECCQNGTRPSWCPLIPIPPHGRLIDADALLKDYDNSFYRKAVVALMEDAATIIPAEPEKENEQ